MSCNHRLEERAGQPQLSDVTDNELPVKYIIHGECDSLFLALYTNSAQLQLFISLLF